MKLSMEMIRKELKAYYEIGKYRTEPDAWFFERAEFYTGEPVCGAGNIYIVRKKQYQRADLFEKDAGVIFVGEPQSADRIREFSYLVLPEQTDLFLLMNHLNDIFQKYSCFERDLLLLTGKAMRFDDFARFLELCSPFFENGLSVLDSNYKIVAEDKTNLEYGNYPMHAMKDNEGDLPSDIVSEFKFNTQYQEIANKREVFIYQDDVLPYRCLCKNIFLDDQFAYRLIVTECVRDFEKTDAFLLEWCAEYFRNGIIHTDFLVNHQKESISKLLSDILENGSVNRAVLKQNLESSAWEIEDQYVVLFVQVSDQDVYLSALPWQCRELVRIFQDAVAFVHQTTIICLVRVTDQEQLEKTIGDFSVYTRENDFRVGISNLFRGLDHFSDYYNQARLALNIGTREHPMWWIHDFSDVTFGYIRNKITEDYAAEELVSPIYKRLQAYDLENGSEYVKTLKVYLENNMNAVQTANDLYVHRATIIYRIKRICEIGRTDLSDKNELLHLGLTFALLS